MCGWETERLNLCKYFIIVDFCTTPHFAQENAFSGKWNLLDFQILCDIIVYLGLNEEINHKPLL